MKKTLSMLLSVLLVISSFIGVFTVTTVSAESTATNLIVNGDFESFNVNTEGNKVPAFAWRNVKTILGTDKTRGQWYRTTGGIGPEASPDLDANYSKITGVSTYPTYFGPNNQMVIEPTESGDSTNHVLRAVQDLNTQIEVKNNGEYSLSFRFKLPQSDTGLTSFGLFLITPNQDSSSLSQTLNSFKEPYNITNATLDPSGTDSGITINSNNKITFSGTSTEWQNVKVIFNVKRNDEVAIPVYTEDEVNYTFPVLMRIGFDTDGINLSDKITDETITNATSYRKKAIYFDDFAMYENINPFKDAKFYNKNGLELQNTNEYVSINKTVNGKKVLNLKAGDNVTATLDYNKDCNVFAGWYKNGERFQRAETLTFTVNDTETYYPKFINKNLLTSSAASYENYAADKILVVTDRTKYPEVGEWGSTFAAGYYGKTYNEVIYDTDHKSYLQTDTGSVRSDVRNTVVDATKAYKGSKSLRLENNYVTFATGLGVKKNTNYTLTYYVTSTASTTVKTGVLTTLNTANGVVPTPLDGGTAFMQYATGNLPAGATMVRSDVAVNSTEWKKITLDFNSGEFEKLYFVVAPSGGETYWIDELSLVENTSETVDVQFMNTKGEDITAECANEAKPAITNSANPGYLVANADYDDNAFDFKGWYNGDTLLSTDKSFEFVSGTYTTLTAKVVSRNILSSTASFEGYNVDGTEYKVNGSDTTKKPDYPSGNLWGTNANNGYYNTTYKDIIYDNTGKAYQQTSGTTQNSTTIGHATVSDAQYKSGSKSLRIDFSWRAASLGIDVTPNTDYKLSYYYYTAAGQSIFEKVTKNQLKLLLSPRLM